MTAPVTPEPPSAGSLMRSTVIALVVAAVLLVTCVLPAEYGKDPTGIGRMLGLTQMGEVKMAIAEEAAANAAAQAAADSAAAAAEAAPASDTAAASPADASSSAVDTAARTPAASHDDH